VSAAPETAEAASVDEQPAPASTEPEQTTEELPKAQPVQRPDEVSAGEPEQEPCVVQRPAGHQSLARLVRQIVEYSGWPGVLRKVGPIDAGWLAPLRWLEADVVLSPPAASAGKVVWERAIPADG
jgi:hypothetical protein